MSPVDEKAQELWDDYTKYKQRMFNETDTPENPWIVLKADRKTNARIKTIQHVLDVIPYSKEGAEKPS